MKHKLENRSYFMDMRAEQTESGSIITGLPIVYDERTDMGYFDEIIERGALDKTDLKDVRFLINHDLSRIPLARSRNNNANSTMQLWQDEKGLNIRVKLDTENNADSRALYSAVERGDVSGMSFMFSVDSEVWENLDTDHPTRRIKEIGSVVEVSAVTFPAYDATEIHARSKGELDSARQTVETARQQRAKSLDSDLEILKAKTKILGGMK